MSCTEDFLKWRYITVNENSTLTLVGYDISFENRNAFNVMINGYPVLPNVPFTVNSLQTGKKFRQSFEINFGTNTGTIFVHVNDDC